MHDQSQISREGDWGDVTVMEDNLGWTVYCCRYCISSSKKFKSRLLARVEDHIVECKQNILKLKENKDFVICKICNLHNQGITNHLKKVHGIEVNEYIKKYNSPLICQNSSDNYRNVVAGKPNYVTKCKEAGIDLTEYWGKVSLGVKKSILENPEERKRRSIQMKILNDKQQSDPEFQKIVSETAKKTSARKDIQEKRAEALKKWRENNPEDFFNKCIKKATTTFQTKPEYKLFHFLSSIVGFEFKRNQFVKSDMFTNSSKRKQIDIADKKKRIYVEFDGKVHFYPIFGEENLNQIKLKDKALEDYISKHNWTLIRISQDQFVYSSKKIGGVKTDNSHFKQETLNKLLQIINSNKPGIYKIGKYYDKY